jgi:PKD repeat protein
VYNAVVKLINYIEGNSPMKVKRILTIIVSAIILAVGGMAFASANGDYNYNPKINVCHENGDGQWTVITINKNDEGPGDFAYTGPPSRDGSRWCEANRPTFACASLAVVADPTPGEVTANITVTATGGASVTGIAYDFGDGTTPVSTLATSDTHTYATNGTYNVNVTISFYINGLTKTASCDPQVTLVSSIVPPVVTPAVTPVVPATSTSTTSTPVELTPGTS